MKTIEKWVEVKAPPGRVFELFGSFENLPRWLTFVRGVERLGNRRALLNVARREASEPSGDWDAQVTESDPPRRVAWRAAGRGASAEVEAEIEETRRGTTLLRVLFTERSSGPGAGGFFSAEREPELEAGLERFKQLAENYDEDATLIARRADESPVAPSKADAELRPPVPARSAPVVPRQPAAESAIPSREEKAFPPAPTARGRGGGDGHDFIASTGHREVRRRRAPLVYAGLAALFALALGALLWGVTRRQEGQSAATGDPVPPAAPASSPIAESGVPEPTSPGPDATPDAVAVMAPTPAATAAGESAREAEETPAETRPATRPAVAGEDERAALETALADWVAATNSQDVAEQMNFYAPAMERYYLQKNFSRRAVREDKTRLAERASLVNITVGEPEVTFDRDGRRATMRFRKQYSIEGSRLSRGEVVQELTWAKTGEGWRIVGERDARVIR